MKSEQQSGDTTIIKAVLTPPLSLDVNDSSSSSSNGQNDYKTPNLLQRILSLFTNVRPGSDLTRLQLPPIFNFPKSQLQCFGESVYCINNGDEEEDDTDLLSRCSNGTTPLERFKAVVAWSISTTRPVLFGVAPFNPILGETHHVSRGNLNVLLEQVSHHPPVTALHATDEKDNLEMIWCHQTIAKFFGASVEAVVHGKRQLKLLNHGENYVMNVPKLLIRFFPVPGTDWAGNVTIRCEESGLEAELSFRGQSFLGFGGTSRSVKGRIINSLSKKTIYKVDGYWDRTVTIKDVEKRKSATVVYNAKEAISRLKTPEVKDPKGLWTSESAVVWSEVSESILNKEWDKAREAKSAIEEREREVLRERKLKGETWVPKHFSVSYSKEGGWECSPHQKWVPPAPIAATY